MGRALKNPNSIDRQKLLIKYQLLATGYVSIKEKGMRRMVCAMSRFPSYSLPFAVFINFHKKGCDKIYLFKEYAHAFSSLNVWDGHSENLPGQWYQCKQGTNWSFNPRIPVAMHADILQEI